MALSYDYTNKYIGVPQADAQPLTMQTLINSIRTEEASERGIVESKIADADGKGSLGGGVTVGITVYLLSTWKLNFAAGAYQATVDGGNLSDALARINNTGSPQVLVRASAAGTIVATGSGVTSQDKVDIANQVTAQMLGARTLGAHLQVIAATLVGESSGAGTSHMTYADGAVTVEADVPLPGATGDRTNVVITGV